MNQKTLIVRRIERRLSTGNVEELSFDEGVNLIVGAPNTGKTKWLQSLDYLLGDPGTDPYEGVEGLTDKYEAITGYLEIAGEELTLERRWKEPGQKTRIFVNDEGLPPKDVQHLILEKLDVPLVHYPKGSPFSGQTWPELSFRTMLRHVYRQQRFWTGLVDQQTEGEQHACLLQFLGLASKVFTPEYGEWVETTRKLERMRAQREAYRGSLQEVARDVLTDEELAQSSTITPTTVAAAEQRIEAQLLHLKGERDQILKNARAKALGPEQITWSESLGAERATLLGQLEHVEAQLGAIERRASELDIYKNELQVENDRFQRALDAGELLADLRVTHCPACEQTVSAKSTQTGRCFLCHQIVTEAPSSQDDGDLRLKFELQRIKAELEEANDLLKVLRADEVRLQHNKSMMQERIRAISTELDTYRVAVSALVNEEVGRADVAMGELIERRRQLGRLAKAARGDADHEHQIRELENQAAALRDRVDYDLASIDFALAASRLQDGMNEYIDLIKKQKPHIWKHRPIDVSINRYSAKFYVGSKSWNVALGGTDSLYFLMAYHYGLLSLSKWDTTNYPGLCIIDLPAEFVGEEVQDLENFIIQPFIDLVANEEMSSAQVIITGASFQGLEGAKRIELTYVYAS